MSAHGTITVTANGATISNGLNGSDSFTLSGSQAQINAALASLTYQGVTNYNGTDSLTVVSNDNVISRIRILYLLLLTQ